MPDHRRTTCRECGGHKSKAGDISWRGLCVPCSMARNEANYDQVKARSGPHFQRWRERTAASVGGVILDDPRERP
jgi:hypothetical protein